MIQYFSSQGGGSGASLNYSIVGGDQEPAGKENRIWVNTGQQIAGHIFSVTAPSGSDISEDNIPEGFIWFKTGSTSIVPFSVTQKNPIMVYPQLCQQFNGTNWDTKKAKSYISGDWHDWEVFLFEPDNAYEDITGGYEGSAVTIHGAASPVTPQFNIKTGETQQLDSWNSSTSGAIVTKNKINLTVFSKIQFDIELQKINTGHAFVYVTQNKDSFNENNKVEITSQTGFLDIRNLTGDWYVAIGLVAVNTGQGAEAYRAYIKAIVNSITMS